MTLANLPTIQRYIGRNIRSDSNKNALQRDLDSMSEWVVRWQMESNIDKCTVVYLDGENQHHRYALRDVYLSKNRTLRKIWGYLLAQISVREHNVWKLEIGLIEF